MTTEREKLAAILQIRHHIIEMEQELLALSKEEKDDNTKLLLQTALGLLINMFAGLNPVIDRYFAYMDEI